MALVLGINGPTSNYFCLWCDCHKNERWDTDKTWSNIGNAKGIIKFIKKYYLILFFFIYNFFLILGRIHSSLLPFLTPKYCVPDELHLMLRIVDVLLECFFLELMRNPLAFDTSTSQENISTREKIEIAMQEIGITTFKFIPPEKRTKTAKWSWQTLMGPTKLKIIEKFPVSNFITGQRGEDIENLWRNFYYLYSTMRRDDLTEEDIIQFSQDARKWVREFSRPTKKTKDGKIEQEGLYQRTDVSPYMHVFAFHIPLFMQELLQQNLYLRWFTTSSVEKKNHEHVSDLILIFNFIF
jgi:hypothetical protein